MGIPTFVLVRPGGFSRVVDNSFASLGFPAEAAKYVFPDEMFISGGDLTCIEKNIDKVIEGLTKWEPKIKQKVVVSPPKITVEGKDYEEALTRMNNLFLRNLWSDGLPILPPTEERVNWLLTGTDLSRDTIVGTGRILPRGGTATVEMLAVCLAMAGGRPEYLPVLIAAVEALINPLLAHQGWTATTGGPVPMVIVNGPVAKQIRLNSGYGCLGPSSEFPAGASIGRAIRFILMNMGGAIPGKGTMSLYGEGRYTNFVFAEDEDGLPSDWQPLNVDQGFPRGSNTLTVDCAQSTNSFFGGAAVTQEDIVSNLKDVARVAGSSLHFPRPTIVGYWLLGRLAAQSLSKSGWSKGKIKAFLCEHGVDLPVPESLEMRKQMRLPGSAMADYLDKGKRWPMPITKPENMHFVVCGGAQSTHTHWIHAGGFRKEPVNAKIKLPANWNQLLRKAEEDLGPIPTT